MVTLPEIIGQPPTSTTSAEMTYNSLPVMEIIPKKPEVELSSTIFSLVEDWDTYNDLLKGHGFALNGQPLRLAYVADNFPTDSFTNQYSESFLNRFTDLVASGAAELSQITGERSAGDAVKKMLGAMESSDVGMISAFGKGATGAAEALGAGFKSVTAGMGSVGTKLNQVTNMVGKLLGGARVDMPMIWKNSGFTPSYSITVRLYNPQPNNQTMKEKYIVGPIAAILLLALPQTDDGIYYNWPFFHTIKVPGLLHVPSAYIGNITLVKGGDQHQIAYTQEMGMVDVRIEFGSLYDTMVVGKRYKSNERPTLEGYLDNMRSSRSIYRKESDTVGPFPQEEEPEIEKGANKRQNQGTVDTTSEPQDRVSTQNSNDASILLINQPTIA